MSRIHEPNKPYNEVESEFIKNRIKERQFELEDDRKYIKDLIFLERIILDEIKLKTYSGQKYKHIKNKHQEEYLKILKDLDEEKYSQEKEKRENKTPSYVKKTSKSEKINKLRADWNTT